MMLDTKGHLKLSNIPDSWIKCAEAAVRMIETDFWNGHLWLYFFRSGPRFLHNKKLFSVTDHKALKKFLRWKKLLRYSCTTRSK